MSKEVAMHGGSVGEGLCGGFVAASGNEQQKGGVANLETKGWVELLVKSLALKAKVTRGQTSNDSVCQDGSDEDKDEEEEFSSIVRNLWKLFKKGVGSSRQERSYYGCGSKNHFVDDCLRAKVKNVFVGGAWSDSEDGNQIKKDTTCLMGSVRKR
uniref:Uncharacterized protein n=1 Tax=Tanacetum cinerariifolium TaxID=118510 RepID=A0A6L2K825_TANCI|nr:hypothetical protein [Tanacetum cinerariifolium]